MKFGRIALLLAGATALEFLVGGSKYRGIWPVDWLLVATAIVARSGGFGRAVLTGAAAGFIEDALTESLLGLNAFAKAGIGYLLAFVSVRVIFGGALAVGGVIALCSLANDAIVAFLRSLLLGAPVVLGSPGGAVARRGDWDHGGVARSRVELPVARVAREAPAGEIAVKHGTRKPC